MKSTLKIAYANQGNLGKPVIKIVQPVEVITLPESDRYVSEDDSRDHLINNLLQSPMNPWLNDWFEVDTRFPIYKENELTHYVTTIASVDEDELFERFRNSIINRIIPYSDLVKINRSEIKGDNESVFKYDRINEFFDFLKSTGKCSYDEQQPDGSQLK